MGLTMPRRGSSSTSTSALPSFSLTSPRLPGAPGASHSLLSPRSSASVDTSSASTARSSMRSETGLVTTAVPPLLPTVAERPPLNPHAASPFAAVAAAANGTVITDNQQQQDKDKDRLPISNVPSVDFNLSVSSDSRSPRGGTLREPLLPEAIHEEHSGELPSSDTFSVLTGSQAAVPGPSNNSLVTTKCSAEMTDMLFGHYLAWVQQCLMDDFAMHVHEADRTDFEFKGSPRKGTLERFASSQQASQANMNQFMIGNTSSVNSSMSLSSSGNNISTSNLTAAAATPPRKGSTFSRSFAAANASMRESTSFVAKMRTINTTRMSLKEQNKSKNRRIRNQDTSLTAELRNVIVLFISVKLDAEQLITTDKTEGGEKYSGKEGMMLMSEKASYKSASHCYVRSGDMVHSRIKSFHFLSRTEEEFNDDQRIMNSFQDCMEIMTKTFKTHGGQMRQFIVDDKGTHFDIFWILL